ncbi:pseudouridine synthase [Segeticoccus rhizosphaerae]|uniref:pseudouridine synthase n=1 Tax=Segeticoccus rhizosphaerae TaxID=1104777 RepID=UPI0010C0F1B8|nr:pseudouridine synthase [Ornithinicoccus soli]
MRSPLPIRDGVNATRLRLPESGPWPTVLAYVQQRFAHLDPEDLRSRFDRHEVVGRTGEPLSAGTPLGDHDFIWYYRDLPAETRIPVEVDVLHRDAHLLVADKPHFLPTTPGGRYVVESALVRLRVALDLPSLVPIHRLDRATAGVLLFSVDPSTRGAYQRLFERREVRKEYHAIAPFDPDLRLPVTVRSRLVSSRTHLRVREEPGAANAETRVELVERRGEHALYRLRPRTGKMHQLRAHLGSLGIGIVGDRLYPNLLPEEPDDLRHPLRLLAHRISFTDPLTGRPRDFTTRRRLAPPRSSPDSR